MNIIKAISDNKSGYCIRLANGQRWQLIATEGKRSWVEKLASIMELETCDGNGYPKLIFIRKETDKQRRGEPICYLAPTMQDSLSRGGWQARKLPAIHVWYHRDVPDVICEYGHEESHELDILRKSLALYPIFRRAQEAGGFPLHAALVERNGEGVLLAASAEIAFAAGNHGCRRAGRSTVLVHGRPAALFLHDLLFRLGRLLGLPPLIAEVFDDFFLEPLREVGKGTD